MWWPPQANHSGKRSPAARLALFLLISGLASAQLKAPPEPSGGQGEIGFQGYYLGGNQQDLLSTTGMAVRFQQFLPDLGLLSGSIEGYGSQNRFQTGENFLELREVPWAGHYWTFTGGDFRMPATLVEFPFNNIFLPEIDARGARVQAIHGDTQFTFFGGEETLTAGPRVAYRLAVPQMVFGASLVRRVAPHLLAGARLMQFSSSAQAIAANPYLFPAGAADGFVRTLAFQSLYNPVKPLKIYAETSRPLQSGGALTSFFGGAAWETTLLTVKANYTSQGILYFPLAGYFAGDRRGPFGEVRFRPVKSLELYGSASQYGSNLEHNAAVPTLTSVNTSAGLSALLPAKISATGQLSTVDFAEQAGGQGLVPSRNRQISGDLSRPFGRHTVHVDWREIKLDLQPGIQRQRSTEAGDTYQFRHFSLGGAARYQQVTGEQPLNSFFLVGLAQVNAGPLSAYANIEAGNDLANQTVFSTQAYRTSVVGLSLRLPGHWNFQGEVFQNQLNLALNPENIFLLQNGSALAGISPAAASLTAFRQWSVYFRFSRQIHWGAGLPAEKPGAVAVIPALSLSGSIEGMVRLKTLAGMAPSASIPVMLDGVRTVVTGADGRYSFDGVPEGMHEVGLALEELPADLDPGDMVKAKVAVQSRHSARADFEVLPLASIMGGVTGPDAAPREDIVIRLLPGTRFTRTRKDGSFTFYNVREGDYDVALDPQSLPEDAEPEAPVSASVPVRAGEPQPPVEFHFVLKSTTKPIRKVLER